MKYIILGSSINDNFGVESLVSGTYHIIKSIHKDAEIVYMQSTSISEMVRIGLEKKSIKWTVSEGGLRVLLDAVLCRLGVKRDLQSSFLRELITADAIIDVYGIYFCNRFYKPKMGLLKSYLSIYRQFQICILGKIVKKKIIKTPASYGPITQIQDKRAAKIAVNKIFDFLFAREPESQIEIKNITKKQIPVLPDVANMIPYSKNDRFENVFGLAVSSQIVKEWKGKEDYKKCVLEMIQYARKALNMKVVLFPNEIHSTNTYNDYHLANEIVSDFSDDSDVTVFDSKNNTHMEQRNAIASCDLFFSSRYHGCVAALSAGVPTLTVGWHEKYVALMNKYQQIEFLIPEEGTDATILVKKLKNMRDNKMAISTELLKRNEIIRSELYGAFTKIL